jgi:integrase/recombinase XerD
VPDALEPSSIKTNLEEAVSEYLADTSANKSKRTLYAYTRTLKVFSKCCGKTALQDVTRRDILNYMADLKKGGNVPRTVSNRIDFLKIFFNHFKIVWPLEKTDKIKYTENAVSAYNVDEISALFKACDREELDLLQFFLFTGSRDQEVQFATWADVDFVTKSFSVTEKLDLNFSPKDKEEGSIPIPNALVASLRERRKRNPGTRLIFPGPRGNADGHLLRILKQIGFREGMNCGHCYNKAGKCCANGPTCKRFELHRFRKTFATFHHEAGISARTIQRWLRHSDLETTLKYLAASDDQSDRTREQVNSTFAFVTGPKVPG